MATNRDLLTEAIADAKTVKDTAIANAKLALEESFTPHLKSMLSAKLAEMEEEDVKEAKDEKEDNVEGTGSSGAVPAAPGADAYPPGPGRWPP